jgi:hypothetical protein
MQKLNPIYSYPIYKRRISRCIYWFGWFDWIFRRYKRRRYLGIL